MRVRLLAQYMTTTARGTVDDVGSVDIDEAEATRRARHHDRGDTRRQQALGLLPRDDELQEMADRAERAHVEDLTTEVQSLWKALKTTCCAVISSASNLTWFLASAEEIDPEQRSGTRWVIKAEITLGGPDGAAADVDTLKAWVEQDSAKTQVALARWAPRPSRSGDDEKVVEATFIYSPQYVASAFRRAAADRSRRTWPPAQVGARPRSAAACSR